MPRLRPTPAALSASAVLTVVLASGTMASVAFTSVALASVASATALVTPTPAAAQEPRADTLALPSLTVTVLRDFTPGTAVPYAVTAAGADELRRGRTGAFLEEALGGLPGVQVQNRYNYAVGERLAIRGFGPRAQFGVRGVKVLVDGIPATMPDGQSSLDHVDLASLGRIEVLRGPASALYGNAAGGVLVMGSEPPSPGPVRPHGRVVVGSDGLMNATGGANGWIGRLGLSFNAGALRYDGFRPDPVARRSDGEGAGNADALYGGAARELFNGRLLTDLGDGTLRVTLSTLRLEAENPGSLPADSVAEGDFSAWTGNVVQGTRKDLDQAQLGAVWDGRVPGGRLEAAAWGIGRSLVNPIPPTIVDLERKAGGARVLFASEDDAVVTWGFGAEAELQRDDRQNHDNDGGERGELTLDQLETVRGLGGFVRAGLGFGPGRVTAALRYDHFRFEADDRFVHDFDPDDSGERTMDGWSPSVGVVAEVSDDLEVWGNVATSIETPTTTELANRPDGSGGFNEALAPQRSVGFEVGARGGAGPRIDWELVAFRTRTDDELVPFEVPSAPGRAFFRNAGESEHEGVEASVEVRPGAGLRGRLVFSRTDARFRSYEVDGEDLAGNRIPGLAPNRFRATLGHELDRFHWSVEAAWTDEVPVDDANDASADPYWLVDARAGLSDVTVGSVVLGPFAGVTNLLDERYAASVTVNAFGGRFYEPGPRRSVYVGFGLRWDRP